MEKTKIDKRLYSIWHNMKSRCFNPNADNYSYYGGRGITVCDEWRDSFGAFREWALANGYREELTIDRKDGNGNYEPSNCQWVDRYRQNSNTKKNHYITHNGETKTASEWARQYGVGTTVFNNRIRRGWPFEQAIKSVKRKKKKEKEGRTQ